VKLLQCQGGKKEEEEEEEEEEEVKLHGSIVG
jgi:hypothetical protein